MASLFGSSGKDTVHLPEGMAELPVEEADNPSTGSHNTVRSSAGAYRNMNRTLDNFYTRAENSERNELLRRIEELEHERQMKKPSQETTMEEKMALMEKSYELAARYNGKQATTTSPAMDKRQRTAVKPVKQVRHQVVSSLSQPASNGESGNGFTGERNVGFNTPVGKCSLLTGIPFLPAYTVHRLFRTVRRCVSACWNRWWPMTGLFLRGRF